MGYTQALESSMYLQYVQQVYSEAYILFKNLKLLLLFLDKKIWHVKTD